MARTWYATSSRRWQQARRAIAVALVITASAVAAADRPEAAGIGLPAVPGGPPPGAAPFDPSGPPEAPEASRSPIPSGSATEIVAKRANGSVFDLGDGTRAARVYASPIHYQTAGGRWRKIDDRVVPDGSAWRNAAGPLDIRFARTAASPRLVTLTSGDHRVGFALEGAAPSVAVTANESITYPQVRPGVDLEFLGL